MTETNPDTRDLLATIAGLRQQLKRVTRERDDRQAALQKIADEHLPYIERLEADNARLVEALTPSAATKYAYMGEFSFYFETAEEGIKVDVPWTTIKEIMAAISARAARQATEEKEDDQNSNTC